MIAKHSSTLARHKGELLKLLPSVHPAKRPRIRQKIVEIEQAQAAEMAAENLFYNLFSNDSEVIVLHDLCLAVENDKQVRVNHVVIDGRSQNIWVIRTIGRAGELERLETGEWRVHYLNTSRRMVSPQDEAERHARAVSQKLDHQGIKNARIKPIVLMGPRVTYSVDGDTAVPVYEVRDFPTVFLEGRRTGGNILSAERLAQISEVLLHAHRRALPSNWYKKLKLGRDPDQPRPSWWRALGNFLSPLQRD